MSQTAQYKYRLYPNGRQREALACAFGCVRYVYNWGLELRTEEPMTYARSSKRLTHLKKETEWLNEVSSVALQQSLRDLQTAFVRFFEKQAQFPSFKKKSERQTARFVQTSFQLKRGKLSLARVPGLIRVAWSRDLPSVPSSVTVERDPSGRYFASFVVAFDPIKLPARDKQVGIDMGITDLIVTSDGFKSGNHRHFRRFEKRLARAQRSLSRKQKGSNNRRKQRLRVAKIHARIADCRKDALDRLSTNLVRTYDLICLEDLSVKNMVRNRRLSKAVSDASWGMFVRMLEYKAEWYGGAVVKIDRWYASSKTCSNCGHVVDKLPLTIRLWTCSKCMAELDRDINAAKNILAVGTTVIASGESVNPVAAMRGVGCSQ
ncbi:MAG: RNA-guided endonuclease TnpB family protein [Rhodothermia bacterium]|nr:MAG: RNA-guided endonuclease TnpB family protein [Rhodothermia bacterium]